MANSKAFVLSLYGPENEFKSLCSKIEMLRDNFKRSGCKSNTMKLLTKAVTNFVNDLDVEVTDVETNSSSSANILNTTENLMIASKSAIGNLVDLSTTHKQKCTSSNNSLSRIAMDGWSEKFKISCGHCFMDETLSCSHSLGTGYDFVTLKMFHAYAISCMQKVHLTKFLKCIELGTMSEKVHNMCLFFAFAFTVFLMVLRFCVGDRH